MATFYKGGITQVFSAEKILTFCNKKIYLENNSKSNHVPVEM
jgi:hypothetical protein